MTLFWTLTGIAIAIPLLLLAPILLRKPRLDTADDNHEHNVRIAREHLNELETEHAKGELSDEEFAQASKDLELALAEDLSTESANRAIEGGGQAGRMAFVAVAVLIPVVTLGLYQRIGAPDFMNVAGPGQPRSADSAHFGAGQQAPSIDEVVKQLEYRLRQDPNNPEGWMMLGRTYMKLEKYPDATRAFESLLSVAPKVPAAMLSLADALAMQNNRRFDARAEQLVSDALAIDPNNLTGLWMAGKAAAERGDNPTAIQYWTKAYPMLAQSPPMQQRLAGLIQQAGGTVPAGAAPALPNIMTAAPQAPAAPAQPPADGKGIPVEVALDTDLLEQASPDNLVFIFAKAVAGPPMPLAVSRHRVADLPIKVTLSDAMAMMPAMTISKFDKVQVSARVSRTGQPTASPGDFESTAVVVETASPQAVQLLINRTVQ